jgi:acyl-CoA synthetase (NDP forming)/GNAT superfamily N-acetyltransferase
VTMPAAATAEERLPLVDGRCAAVRPTRPDDAGRIAALIAGLSVESRALRFGAARRGLSPEEARAMAAAPGAEGAGLIALAGTEGERAVALARYERAPGAPEAELALAVDDAWQGLGLGTGLIERLLERAREDGLDALWALVRPDNHRMRHVFRDLGGGARELRGRDEVMVRLPTRPDDRLEEAETARFAGAAAASLEPLFRPRAIAVVGASRDPASPGGAVMRALAENGFPGAVYQVNRSGASVAGRTSYPALALLPEPADLVVVAVRAEAVPGVARDAAAHGARALVVLSAGFAESGAGGAALEAELVHIARTAGLRVLGPNCLGIAVNDPSAPFDATFAPVVPRPGRLAFASQSGGLGIGALAAGADRGLGLSAFVSLGNKADISSNDLLAWWESDPGTRAIALYLEGFGNPRRFARLARRVARTTPIVALKAGRGAAGRRGAGSHTAAMAAGEAPTDALFELAGVTRVDTVQELFAVGQILADQPRARGDRVAILANAGGPAILAADACEAAGARVPALPPELRERLDALDGLVAGTSNPVDLGAGAGPETFAAAGRALLDSGAVDALLVVHTPTRRAAPAEVAAAVQGLADGRLPVVGCLLGGRPGPAPEGTAWPVPWLDFPESAARSLALAMRAASARPEPDAAPEISDADPAAARRALESAAPGGWLEPLAVEELLRAYGLIVARSAIADDPDAAARAQEELGAPVAVKLVGAAGAHKSDVGGVILGASSPEAAAEAYRHVEAGAAAAGLSGMRGALVQAMAPEGIDLIVGAVADPTFGPLVLVGIGGVEAELWGDRALALAPVGPETAGGLWARLRGAPLLDGWRGGPVADRAALVDVAVRLGRLAAEQPLLAELDCNPVRALPGGGALVLDARARRADA